MGRNERGQVFPLVALMMLVTVGTMWVLAITTVEINAKSRAQTAADAAALAAVTGGKAAAARAAEVNGGRLVSVSGDATGWHAKVELGNHVAEAKARSGGDWASM